jgi:hypothetical protein
MFRALLASGLVALLGFAAPAKAEYQHYQPGFPLVYYNNPVPQSYGYARYAGGYGHYHQPRRTYWHDSCRCATPYGYGRRHVARQHVARHAYGHAPRHSYAPRYGYAPRYSAAPRYGYAPRYSAAPRYGYAQRPAYRGGVYVETQVQRRPVRQMAESYGVVDRPYGYAYRPRPSHRNVYSNAYREDHHSWRSRRDGIVVVNPRSPVNRPVPYGAERSVQPGRSGALIVTTPRGPSHQHVGHGRAQQRPEGRPYRGPYRQE